MNSISTLITEYLDSCRTQKCLDEKTLNNCGLTYTGLADKARITRITRIYGAIV